LGVRRIAGQQVADDELVLHELPFLVLLVAVGFKRQIFKSLAGRREIFLAEGNFRDVEARDPKAGIEIHGALKLLDRVGVLAAA
jgi:hypothetical protein